MAANIEVEVRAFIMEPDYQQLLSFFKAQAQFINEDDQVTYYFDSSLAGSPVDLRIQRGQHYAKVWLKKGKIHDEFREEIEIKLPLDDFDKLEQLFLALGYNISIKWFRHRHQFLWDGITVTVDYTKGYGYIVELELMSSVLDQEATAAMLKEKLLQLGFQPTSRATFDQAYHYYQQNWRSILGGGSS